MDYVLPKLHIPKDGKDWYIYYSCRHPDTGEMLRFKERDGINRLKTKKEKLHKGTVLITGATNKLKAGWSPLAKEVERNPYHGQKLLEIFEQFKKIKESSNLKETTIKHYKYAIDLLTEFLTEKKLEGIRPIDFTSSLAKSYIDYLGTEKKFSGKSHNNQLLNMGVFFNMLVEREVITKNPFKSSKKKATDSSTHVPYSDEQRTCIKEYLKKHNPNMFTLIQFIYYCFIRPRELTFLQVKHIDWKNSRIQIPGNVSKNRKQTSVEIPKAFIAEVKGKFYGKNPEYYLFGRNLECCEIKVHPNRYSDRHKLMLEDLKIDRSHTLYAHKHTGAIAFINAGGNPYALMLQARHYSLEQTMIYLRKLGLQPNTEFSIKQPKF